MNKAVSRGVVGLWLALATALAAGSVGAADNPSGGAISHHALAARIDPETAFLEVVDTLTIVHEPGTPGRTGFPFLLAKTLELRSVEGIGSAIVHEEGRIQPRELWESPPYDELEGYVRTRQVTLRPEDGDAAWPEELRVVVSYAGTVYDSLRPPESEYARGFETTSGLIDPRGAFLSSGTFWTPQRPFERFSFRGTFTTPADWHAVSQGGLVDSRVAGGERTNLWDCPHTMEEIYFVAGPYTLRREDHEGIEVMTFTYAETDSALCRRYLDGTKRYLDFYGEKIGPYPFAKFAMVENFWQTGFGMPSFTLLGNRVIRLPFILDTSYGHEILHNWWGNGVFVDYHSGNWCEGLTAYGADYLYKEQESPEAAAAYRRSMLQGYADYVSQPEDFPLREFRQRHDFATQAIGYGKSMMVFHQVRRALGEWKFYEALREFYYQNLYHHASWDDLFATFDRYTPRDMLQWKEQWIDRAGAPKLEIRSHRLIEVPGRRHPSFEVTIAQTQPDLYDLIVTVAIGWGRARMKDHVDLTGEEATIRFKIRQPPEWIEVDPDYDLLRRIDPAEIPPALSRLLGADTALVVIAGGLPEAERQAYRAVAEEWGSGARIGMLDEREVDLEADPPAVPTWFLGLGETARERIDRLGAERCVVPAVADSGWTVDGTE
ncbi:MAG: hypothetical protein GF346_11270, partial [Candidatus Eisenbacteria bacterium]|nr:hypothetical protein [Candidatus Latescibacterota bacterium]MBD3303015.1 hypothetical protein [Candidatus Eisenbacteria bacterium]